MTPALMCFIAAALFLLAALWAWNKESVARKWPQVAAQIEAIDLDERLARGLSELDARKRRDRFVVYSFAGKSYRRPLAPEATMSLGGVEVARSERALGALEIRVDPQFPESFYDPVERGRWKIFAAVGTVVLVAGVLLQLR